MSRTASISTTLTSEATSSSTTGCVTVTPDPNGYVPEYACNSNYFYNPSFAAALLFAVLFNITAMIHIIQAFYHKKVRLCSPLLMGVIWETLGFAIRSAGTRNQQSFALSFSSQLFILLAPMWVNAFVYMVLGRMVFFFIPEKELWRVKGIKIAKIFIWLDVLSFLVQAAGGSMIQPDSSSGTIGIYVYMGGIGFQQFCILVFASIAVRFYIVMQRLAHSNSIPPSRQNHWKLLLCALLATLAAISIRIVFRLVEFASGLEPEDNPIPFHEAYFYTLDGVPMLFACIFMNVFHPGRFLQGEGSEFPRIPRKERKAAKKAKKMAKVAMKEEEKARKKRNKAKRYDSGYNEETLLQEV